jgi:glycosyltransferase involved in cell wall biosynthesis
MRQPIYSIVQVTDQLNIGGAEQIVVMLANLLQAHGHSTAVVTTVAPGPLASKLHSSVQHINIGRQWKWNPVTMYRLVKVLKQFDIVHVHSSYNLRYVYLASRLFFLRKPIFYHEHFGDIDINTTVAWHQKWIYPNVAFIAVSRQLAEWAILKIKLSPKNVFLLQNTIVRQENKLTNSLSKSYQLVLVANIRRIKHIEFAIELIKGLNNSTASYYLTIIGQVRDKVYYNEIQQLINNYSLAKHVHFNHNCNDIQPLLSNYHLALHTSKSETGPLVLIEYLAQGLPFITYNTGEVVQQLQPHLPTFIMQDFSVEKWLQSIERACSLPRERVVSKFMDLYQKYFSLGAYYNQCMAIYHEVLKW